MKRAAACIVVTAAIVSGPATGTATVIVAPDEQVTAGDWQVTGSLFPPADGVLTRTVDFILYGKNTGHFAGNLTNPPDDTSHGNDAVYPLSGGNSVGSISLGELRGFFTSRGLPLSFVDDLPIGVTLDAAQNDPVQVITRFDVSVVRGGTALRTFSLAGRELSLTDHRGISRSDYVFRVMGGMHLGRYLDTDTLAFDLHMTGLTAGAEIFWIAGERLVPDPATLLLLALGALAVARRRPR